jgi:hypothetical protein
MKRIILIGPELPYYLQLVSKKQQLKKKRTLQTYEMTTEIPTGVLTPDKVETSIGTLEYFDGVPTKTTCRKCI